MNYVSQENLDNIVRGLSNKIAMSVSNGVLIVDTTYRCRNKSRSRIYYLGKCANRRN